jgi:membrane protein
MLRFKIFKKIGSFISFLNFRKVLAFLDHYILKLFKRMDEHNLFFAGAGISFSLFLGMIPFILLVFSLLGIIFDQATIEGAINNLIDQIIPYPSYANYVKRVISSRLPEVIEYKTLAGFVGVIGLLFTSTWIFSSIRTILNQIYNVKIQRGYLYGMFRDILMVILLVLFISGATFIAPAINIIYEVTKNYDFVIVYTQSPLWKVIVYSFSFVLLFSLFFFLYYLIPYEQLGKKVAAVSAFWSTLLWEVARYIFGYYINHILGTNPLYGAFVLIIAILFWVFYSSCLFIVGAELGQLYREKRAERLEQMNSLFHQSI